MHEMINPNAYNQEASSPCLIFFGFGLILLSILFLAIAPEFERPDGPSTPRIIGTCMVSIGAVLAVVSIIWACIAKRQRKNRINDPMGAVCQPPGSVLSGSLYAGGPYAPVPVLPGLPSAGDPYAPGPSYQYPPGQNTVYPPNQFNHHPQTRTHPKWEIRIPTNNPIHPHMPT